MTPSRLEADRRPDESSSSYRASLCIQVSSDPKADRDSRSVQQTPIRTSEGRKRGVRGIKDWYCYRDSGSGMFWTMRFGGDLVVQATPRARPIYRAAGRLEVLAFFPLSAGGSSRGVFVHWLKEPWTTLRTGGVGVDILARVTEVPHRVGTLSCHT